MEVRHHQWRSGMENTKQPAVNYGYRPECNRGIPPHRTSNTPEAHCSDIVEKDSRSVVGSASISAPQPMFIPRSPFMDAEKDMTRTPTTPKSPPVPVAPSPLTSQDGKMPRSSGGGSVMMPRGAHIPAYHRSSTSSNTTVSSTSSSSSSGGSGHAVSQQLPPRSNYGYGGAGMGMERPLRSHAGSSFHRGQHGDVGGVTPGPEYHYHYHKSGQQTYDPRFRVQPQSSVAAALYGQPTKPYSSYPSESYGYTAHHTSRYSRPLSTGSLSSASSSVSSRPGFSSLDEFPNLYDHHSTFAPPHGEGDVHRATVAASNSSYRPFHDVHPPSGAVGVGGGFVGSPLSPLSSCDEHQPLLSLQQQSSLLLGDATSDELAGQLTNEMSRKLSLQDQRTSSRSEARSQRLSAGTGQDNSAVSCIRITEHPKDLEVFPNERAVLRCTARIISGTSQNREKEAELGEEPNLLWYKDAEPLIGEIDGEYVVEEMSEKDVGFYYCLVSHPENDKIQKPSDMARLTVKRRAEGGQGGATATGPRAPEILEQPPRDVFAVIDEKLQIPLKAAGTQLRYRWYKDNKEMRYADGPVLLISSARFSDSGVYCCSVSNEYGSVLSNNSLVKVTQVRDSTSVPGSKRPTSLYDWGDQPLSDSFLRDVGTAIARQTANLDRIGLYLGLRNDDIIDIKQHFHVAEERAFHLLRRWRNTGQRERSTLKIILTQAGIKLDLLAAGSSKKPAAAKPPPQPPRIITHPKSSHVIYGQGLSLSVQVDPAQPLLSMQYQWYRNSKPLGGKMSQSIIISSATEGDAGDYCCVVSNGSVQTASKVARVEVVNPHVARQLPAKAAATTSSAFVNASGLGGVYRIPGGHGEGRFNAVRSTSEPGHHGNHPPPPPHGEFLSREACTVNRASLGSLELERESMVGGGREEEPGGQPVGWDYLTRSANREGQETAGMASLPSQQPPPLAEKKQQLRIIEHPKSQQVEAGDPLTLTCTVAGAPPTELSYTWYFNGLSLAGENRPIYEINFFTDEDEGLYQCRVQSSHSEVMSRMAHIEMKEDNSD